MQIALNTPSPAFEVFFLALQTFVVLFLLLHDWVPLGRLSNLSAIRHEDSLQKRIIGTLVAAAAPLIGLFYSARYFRQAYPHSLVMLLWITYGIFLLGLLRAWWIPYLVLPDPARAARYQVIFAGTHSFLPPRNGIVPDTLHVLFHAAIVITLIALFVRDRMIAPHDESRHSAKSHITFPVDSAYTMATTLRAVPVRIQIPRGDA